MLAVGGIYNQSGGNGSFAAVKGGLMNEEVLDFQQIHADYRPKILRYLTRMVGESEAEDLTQDVFVKINQALPTFRGESKVSTWVYRIASNAALDRMRSPSFKRIVPLEFSGCPDPDVPEIKEEIDIAGDGTPSVEQELFRKQRFDCYQQSIQCLPEKYQKVIMLSELEDLAAGEIADILGISVEAVKMRLHRGKAQLLAYLKSHCKSEDWL
jgi:RNA polymerase sigma-70 factor (ECF subfamily)